MFDGHGGVTAAEFASRHLLDFTLAEASFPAHLSDALVRSDHQNCSHRPMAGRQEALVGMLKQEQLEAVRMIEAARPVLQGMICTNSKSLDAVVCRPCVQQKLLNGGVLRCRGHPSCGWMRSTMRKWQQDGQQPQAPQHLQRSCGAASWCALVLVPILSTLPATNAFSPARTLPALHSKGLQHPTLAELHHRCQMPLLQWQIWCDIMPLLQLVANAGDSRAVLCRGGKAVTLSTDHKPATPAERARILDAGGAVCHEGRLNGELTVARSIGELLRCAGMTLIHAAAGLPVVFLLCTTFVLAVRMV